MKLQYPELEDFKDWNVISERQRRQVEQAAEISRPYVERLLELAAEMDQVAETMREIGIWDPVAPNHEIQNMLESHGFYGAWVPSANEC